MLSALAFGKKHHVVSTIHHLTGESEAVAKATLLRQREHVEEEHHQKIFEPVQPTPEDVPALGRMTPFAKQLAVLGDYHFRFESCRQGKQDQRMIHYRHMVRDKK